MTATLVILGGADGTVSTYRRARELGYRTICVDMRPSAPSAELADEYLPVSVRAPEQIAAALLERSDIAGVLCPASDVGLRTLSWLTHHWNLPNPLPESAVLPSVDKAAFREICQKIGLPTYGTVAGLPGPELVHQARSLRFPTLVKPVDSSGSRGVVSCAGPGQLHTAFTQAIAHSPSGRVLVEEFIDGQHFAIEALVLDGRVAFHAVSERTLTPPPFFVTSSHLVPGRLPTDIEVTLAQTLDLLCAEIELWSGVLTLDAVLGLDGKLYLIEMSARMGGNGLADVIERCSGVDLIGASIALAVGKPVAVDPRPGPYALVHVLASDRAGYLAEIKGLEQVLAIPEVVDLQLFVDEGSAVRPYEQAGYKLGQVVLASESVSRLRAAEAEVRATVKFRLADQDLPVPLP